MADCVDDRYVASDEYLDPRCEPCFDSKKRSVHVYGYCHECYKFMCPDCHFFHKQFPLAKNHVIVRGSNMPKSLADKPPKYERCDDHPRQWKDLFCCDHKELVCSTCSNTNHKTCPTKSVDDVCKTISSSENGALCDAIKNLIDEAKSVKDAIETDIEDLAEQRNTMMQETKQIGEHVISKVNELFQNIQSETAKEYQFQNGKLNEKEEKINDIKTRMERILDDAKNLKGKPFDAKLFVNVYEHVQAINQSADEFRALNQSRHLVSLSFDQSNLLKEIMSNSASFGSLTKEEFKQDVFEIKDITFPQSLLPNAQPVQVTTGPRGNQQSPILPVQAIGNPGQITATVLSSAGASTQPRNQASDLRQRRNYYQPAKQNQHKLKRNAAWSRPLVPPVPLSQIKGTKQNSFNINLKDDILSCLITGMAITKDNRRLLVDHENMKVKMFSTDMKFLSSVSVHVHGKPRDIAVVNDDAAIVTTDNMTCVLLDISGRQLSISRPVTLDYSAVGISRCKDKFVVACPDSIPPSVKLIDQTGRMYWSVSTDKQGRQLFECPGNACCHYDGGTSTVVVTDLAMNTLTQLNAETGDVVTIRQLEGYKTHLGVTTDMAGNVYVCFNASKEVSVFTGDLSEERILLTTRDGLSGHPYAIVYDETRSQLIVSYFQIGSSSIDCFQLS